MVERSPPLLANKSACVTGGTHKMGKLDGVFGLCDDCRQCSCLNIVPRVSMRVP